MKKKIEWKTGGAKQASENRVVEASKNKKESHLGAGTYAK